MATIYDGARVFAAADGASILAANHNTFQDQMILGMQARTQILGPEWGSPNDAATNWTFQCDGQDPPRWADNTCNSVDNLIIPIPLREKEYLEDIYVVVTGARGAGVAEGEIGLYYSQIDTGTPAVPVMVSVQNLGGADPWNVAGAVTAYSSIGLNLTADMDTNERKYFLLIKSHSQGGVSHARYYGTRIDTRFHVGS